MEHRLKSRRSLSMDVLVRGGNDLTLNGRVRDLSTDGMFIQLTQKVVSTNAMLDIELSHGIRLHGWVVHAGDEGIGVVFRSLSDQERTLIEELLVEKSVAL